MHTKNTRAGFALAIVPLYIAGALFVTWLVAPSVLPGTAARRAAVSTATTADLLTAQTARASTAAAKVTKIQEANTAAPPSPAREFIALESASALADLPPPAAAALIEAEKRRAAVFAGERDEARRLYGLAAEQSEKLAADLAAATAARQAADVALVQAAAASHRATLAALAFALVAAGAAFAFFWFKAQFGGFPQAIGWGLNEMKAQQPAAFALAEPFLTRYMDRHEQRRICTHSGF
jgi:hypothetical protein